MNARLNAFFSYGFRPFFLAGALYAVIAVIPWVLRFAVADGQGLPWLLVPDTAWHAHEMLFGFAGAIIAGFFLTAVPNWTGGKPVSGLPLAALFIVWALGRIVNWLPFEESPYLFTLIDLAFVPFLVALVLRALIAGWSKRNLIFLPIFAGLFIANLMVHLERLGIAAATAGQGHRLALDLIVALIIILGGRVVPSFTTNYLRNHGNEDTNLPRQSDRLTQLAVLSAALMVIVNQAAPDTAISAIVYAVAALANLLRFLGWQGHRVLHVPILWILFAGYGFIIIGLAAHAISVLTDILPSAAADHLLTIGGVGCMTLGIMTRASLGHTGRTPWASPAMLAAFLCVVLAALIRAIGPVVFNELHAATMIGAGALWMTAYGFFVLSFFTVLTTPRPQKGR